MRSPVMLYHTPMASRKPASRLPSPVCEGGSSRQRRRRGRGTRERQQERHLPYESYDLDFVGTDRAWDSDCNGAVQTLFVSHANAAMHARTQISTHPPTHARASHTHTHTRERTRVHAGPHGPLPASPRSTPGRRHHHRHRPSPLARRCPSPRPL